MYVSEIFRTQAKNEVNLYGVLSNVSANKEKGGIN